MSLDFAGSVALVTGAGNGLGRVYAHQLAARGCRVVVNDVAVAVDGSAESGSPAQRVVDEITAAGGTAVADDHSVATPEGGAAIVAAALETFGDLDIVVNNAGIARTNHFRDAVYDDVTASLSVHLLGAFHILMPAWKHLIARGGGRVVNTTSAVGLFGQRRSAVYAAAKMGIVGLTRVLAQEGAEHNIKVNAVAPVATSRMAAQVYGRLDEKVPPEYVSAVVLALAHPSCPVTAEVISAGGGRLSRIVLGATEGYYSPTLDDDEAAAHLAETCAQERIVKVPDSAMSEIDLIRQCFPDLADFPMQPR